MELARDLLPHPRGIVVGLDLEIGFEEFEDGEVGGGLPIRHGPGLQAEQP